MEDSMNENMHPDGPQDGLSEDQRAYAEIVFGTKDFVKDPRFIEWQRRLAAHKKKGDVVEKKPHEHDVC